LRLDKMIYQALETTLRHLLLEQWDQVPALRMIRLSAAEIRERAERLLNSLQARQPGFKAELTPGESVIGGGATPEQSIPTWLIAIECADEGAAQKRLRAHDPPVIARIEEKRLLLDLRTVLPEEEAELAAALQALS
jgi:L-seryl-tRNA(Ser) seleniumtransferase